MSVKRHTGVVVLRKGRERSVALAHPWVLSGSVVRVEGEPEAGDVVALHDESGAVLGFGDFDPDAQIRVRIFAFGKDEPDEGVWLEARLAGALALRRGHPLLSGTNALRLAHAEADGLPGLVIDRYADFVALRVGTPAMARRAGDAAEIVRRLTGARAGWLRSEGAASHALFGSVPDEPIEIEESGRRYLVDLKHGQKTGFYLDQRDARDLFAKLARGTRALDLFAHTGGFASAALRGRRARSDRGRGVAAGRGALARERAGLRARDRRRERVSAPRAAHVRPDLGRSAALREEEARRARGLPRVQGPEPARAARAPPRARTCSPSAARTTSRRSCSASSRSPRRTTRTAKCRCWASCARRPTTPSRSAIRRASI